MKKIIFFPRIILTLSLFVMVITAYGQDKDYFDIGNRFIPAGYMGCTNQIVIEQACKIKPKTPPLCYKISWTQPCNANWAGVYWTNSADESGANWGQSIGTNLSKFGFKRISFWARGENGGEVVEFGCGGIDKTSDPSKIYKYKDSFQKTFIEGKMIVLEKDWIQYTIDLKDLDLSSVIGGFYWSANQNSNLSGLVFYLDDIRFEK
jgi:hypothetical protein